jgi:hypothetical protein
MADGGVHSDQDIDTHGGDLERTMNTGSTFVWLCPVLRRVCVRAYCVCVCVCVCVCTCGDVFTLFPLFPLLCLTRCPSSSLLLKQSHGLA